MMTPMFNRTHNSLLGLAFLMTLGLAIPAHSNPASGDAETLFKPSAPLFPAQGGPGVKTLFLPQGTALLVGGSGSLMVGDNFGIGLGGYSLANELVIQMPTHKRDLGLSYGGLEWDYSILPKRLFYLNFSCMTGVGQAFAVPRLTGADRIQSNFYYIDPQFNIMLNVTHELRFDLGVGYFATAGADLKGTLGTELNGFNLQILLFYGKL